MNFDEFLDDITSNDELKLLVVKKKTSALTADEHLATKFHEINEFISANGNEPKPDMANVTEYMLHQRLNSIRSNELHCDALREHDVHSLLPDKFSASEPVQIIEEPKTIDDLMSNDPLGLLNNDSLGIFKMKNVPKSIDMPSKIASRKRCKDFEKFESLFKSCHADLDSDEKEQVKFTGEQQIQKGQFFVLHGVMCYVVDMEERVKKNGKVNAKLHLIFENGTESNMLLRSLATELYKDETGRRIMPKSENALDNMLGISDDDQTSGYIYILQSLSKNEEIKSIKNLYKIGYSRGSVEKRIANAANEPTYLMAPVHIVASFQCFNLNTQKFENLLHTFFGSACLDIEIVDGQGKPCRPREWFSAPIKAIEMAIILLINKEIVSYRFDVSSGEVIEKD